MKYNLGPLNILMNFIGIIAIFVGFCFIFFTSPLHTKLIGFLLSEIAGFYVCICSPVSLIIYKDFIIINFIFGIKYRIYGSKIKSIYIRPSFRTIIKTRFFSFFIDYFGFSKYQLINEKLEEFSRKNAVNFMVE